MVDRNESRNSSIKENFVRSNKAYEYELIRSAHMLIYKHIHTYMHTFVELHVTFDNVIGFVQSVPLD